jgi:hypothetical protein
MVYPRSVKGRGASNETVDFITLFQEEFGEVGTVLAGNPSD